MNRRLARIALTTSLLMLGGVIALLPLVAQSAPREIVIVASKMTFQSGDRLNNPTLRVRVGERVRLVLVNEDAGFDHDLSIPSWSIGTTTLRGPGRTSIDVQVPNEPGQATYLCTLHSSMMSGTIDVVAADVPIQ